MGYSGYERILCKNGHLDTFDCYNAPDLNSYQCSECNEGAAWLELVDTTNGFDEDSETELVVKEERITSTCGCCGHVSQVHPRTYVIPTDNNTIKLK